MGKCEAAFPFCEMLCIFLIDPGFRVHMRVRNEKRDADGR